MPIDETELLKLRLDYAWTYFDSASRQRMLFINYFFVAVGILASAYGLTMKEALYPVACYVCLFGILASFSFIVLDYRMLIFVKRALDVLETLERQSVFVDGELGVGPGNTERQQLGLARIEPDAGKSRSIIKVKVWIRLVQGCAALGFLCGMIYAASLWRNAG